MIKTAALVAALAIGFATASYAQTSSPAGENSTAQKSGNMGSSSGSTATRPTGTTGMSSGGAARTSTGGANGSPGMAPHTTTGPQGPASESESPAK